MLDLEVFNHEQQRAILATDGPMVIVAGPGTGKTKTLTARMAHLCEIGVNPSEVLALTFTKKAAEEMRSRIAIVVPKAQPKVSTFHALCYELLGGSLPFIEEAARLALIKDLKKAADLKTITTRELALEISRVKNLPIGESTPDTAIAALVVRYNQALANKHLCDFDDLLRLAHQKLQEQQLPYRYILVDEFQDTNLLQYQLLQLLNTTNNICVIGDPLQSIYGFRGASGTIFEQFKTDFPDYQEVTLTTNYRSAPEITKLSNALFAEAPQLHAHSTTKGEVQAVQVLNEYGEAQWIITQIESALGGTDFLRSHTVGQSDQHCQFQDFAVLYRTHQTAKVTQRLLSESGIPYQIVGEGSPYEQPTVATIIAVVRAVVEGIEIEPPKGFTAGQWQVIRTSLLSHKDENLSELCAQIITALGIEIDQTVRQFTNSLVRFKQAGPKAFLCYVDEIAEQGFYDPHADAVTLLTIHAAKGLEFRHVFLIGAEEEILPHKRVLKEETADEEKRLFYVAATRAKEKLDILHTNTRAGHQSNTSRFVTELPEAIMPRTIDPQMATQITQRKKRQQKRAQTSLF